MKNKITKQSEFIDIPLNWEVRRLGDISQIIVPMRDKPKKFDGNIPWIRIEDFEGKYVYRSKSGRCVSQETIQKMNLKPYPIGTVLCSCSGNMGICAITGSPLVSNQTFAGIVPTKEIDSEYLYYLLTFYKYKLQILSSGTTIAYISRDKFESLLVPIPPIVEQKKIVSILAMLDDAIEKTNTIIQKTNLLKSALMKKIFTQGIYHKNIQHTKIGIMPENWKIAALEEVAEIYGGSTPNTNLSEYWNGDIPFVTPTDVTKLNGHHILTITKKRITSKGLKSKSLKILPPGTVLVTTRATIGIPAINGIPITTNQGFTNLVCKEIIHNIYLFYLIKYYKKQLEALANGSTFKEISKKNIRQLMIPIPPIEEQREISKILALVEEKIRYEQEYNHNLQNIKKGLMANLLTGTVKVSRI
jgi:type I restriction enzyme, S subunit